MRTNPRAHWRDNGSMMFHLYIYHGSKHDALEAAKHWASERYGVQEWVKAPWRETWVDRVVRDSVMADLKKARDDDRGA